MVQPPVFVTAALKQKPCSHLVTWRPVAPAGIKSGETQNLCFVDYTNCRSTLLIRKWILAFCLCTALFFLALQRGTEPYFDTDVFPAQLLAGRPDGCIKISLCLFLHILSPLDKALVEKPIFVQVGSICASNLSSGTALQQDFVIRKAG